MNKRIIIDAAFPSETRVAALDKHNNIENLEISSHNKPQLKGNIYLAKVIRIEPSLQAAFINYGNERAGFLPFSEIHSDYYHCLSSSKKDDKLVSTSLKSVDITAEDLEETPPSLIDPNDIDLEKAKSIIDNGSTPDIDIGFAEDDIELESPQEENNHGKDFKIQEVIKKGQIMLVQVTKEERGNKGAAMTTYISLAGKYTVLMPNKGSQNGISRKISNLDERKRLKKIINELSNHNNKSYSVIARTAGLGHTTVELKKDYDYLARLWNKIREATLQSSAPSFIHQEDGILLKTIRDMLDSDVKELLVQGKEAYEECIRFTKDIMPNELKKIKEYKGKLPIFSKFNIESQLIDLYHPIVNLPSGGYIVINPTEALISIDVNSGKATGERNVEEMALRNNIEAAKEIAKHARLRDLSGLIVIDFIDLCETKNRKILERYLWEVFSKDKARVQTSNISAFGLLEMSRQRLKPSFLEMNSIICDHCNGNGVIRNKESNSMLILRTIENEILNSNYSVINVYSVASSILELLNEKRAEILSIEKKYNIKLNFYIDRDASSDGYSIEKIKKSTKTKESSGINTPKLQHSINTYSENIEQTSKEKTESSQNKNESDSTEPTKKRKITKARKKINKSNKTHQTKDTNNVEGAKPKDNKSDVLEAV